MRNQLFVTGFGFCYSKVSLLTDAGIMSQVTCIQNQNTEKLPWSSKPNMST